MTTLTDLRQSELTGTMGQTTRRSALKIATAAGSGLALAFTIDAGGFVSKGHAATADAFVPNAFLENRTRRAHSHLQQEP